MSTYTAQQLQGRWACQYGWPIASGPVEGACKNLIKNRMERSGMRWTEKIAEALVQLRAIYLSGDFDAYWELHIKQDQRRIYFT